MQPFFVAVLGYLFLKERLSKNDIMGGIIIIFAAILITSRTVENLTNFEDEIDFTMFSETFKNLPVKRDYIIEIRAAGFIGISLVDDNMKLGIYTGRVKK